MHSPERGNSPGFTLVEMIASLVLMGILASLAGFGIVRATQGFMFARDNTIKTQTLQLASARITKAVNSWLDHDGLNGSWLTDESITLVRKQGEELVQETYAFNSNDQTITVAQGNGPARLLAQGVEDLSFTYFHTNGTAWTPGGDDLANLAGVGLSITLEGKNSDATTFQTRLLPRNTYDPTVYYLNPGSGGASLPTVDCFVATTGFGDPRDPCVFVLRQFRDRILSRLPGGEAMIRFYYAHGPALADLIRGSEPARALTRAALAPLVGTAFCLLYFPGGILIFPCLALALAVIFNPRMPLQRRRAS